MNVVRVRLRGSNGQWDLTADDARVLVRKIRTLVARPGMSDAAETAAYALQLAIDAAHFDDAQRPAIFEHRHRPIVLLALDALERQGRLTATLAALQNALRP